VKNYPYLQVAPVPKASADVSVISQRGEHRP
jgi:hypothetical protein